MFVRCYQQSLFAFLAYFPKLKILTRKIKKLDGLVIAYGGVPESVVTKKFPEAITTEWGYEVSCTEVDEGEFLNWLDYVIVENEKKSENGGKH